MGLIKIRAKVRYGWHDRRDRKYWSSTILIWTAFLILKWCPHFWNSIQCRHVQQPYVNFCQQFFQFSIFVKVIICCTFKLSRIRPSDSFIRTLWWSQLQNLQVGRQRDKYRIWPRNWSIRLYVLLLEWFGERLNHLGKHNSPLLVCSY